MSAPLLELDNVTMRFGGLTARVATVDLKIGEGELVGLIGPNGAGKTTVFNLITGVYQPTAGDDSLSTGKSVVGHQALHRSPRAASRAPFKTSASSPR